MQKFIPGSSGRWIHLAHSPGTTQKKKNFFSSQKVSYTYPKNQFFTLEEKICSTFLKKNLTLVRKKTITNFPNENSFL